MQELYIDRLLSPGKTSGGVVGYLITNAPFKLIFWFRIGNYLRTKNNILAKVALFVVKGILKHYQLLTGIQLDIGTKIGEGLCIAHFAGIVINNSVVVGKKCTIFQGVTIGSMRGQGIPIIGDNCIIFTGAKIIGNVQIGNNVVIGAGAVVVKNLPDNCVAVGVPAKIVSYKGPDIVKYY